MPLTERDRALSRAVHLFAAECGSRRAVPTMLHVGTPAGEEFTIPHEDWYDDGLRIDLVERALACVDVAEPLVWLTRRGDPRPQDVDHAWCAATVAAALRVPCSATFYVVTRRAWLELQTGRSRRWARIR